MKRLIMLLGAGLALSSFSASAAAPSSADPVVKTPDGALRGVARDGAEAFLGVPFAVPPVGELRWRPPVAAKPWRGVRDATRKASSCAQVTTLAVFAGPTSTAEDCLYLNVYTTGRPAPGGQRKPVIVWFHGGALLDGSGNDYEGWKLAKGGSQGVPAVVVTIN
jgi:para-nitrobenzyl esterase